MTEADFDRFSDLLGGLAEALDAPLSVVRIEGYFAALRDMDIDSVASAIGSAMRNSTFFPKPAELRAFIEGSAEDKANQAWETVMDALKHGGFWNSVAFRDGAIGQTINSVFGGWVACSEALHNLSDEMITAKRKEFMGAYRNAVRQGREVNYLPGYHETNNRASGHTWKTGWLELEDGSEAFRIPVYLAERPGQGRSVEALFDRHTGQLVGGSQDLFALPAAQMKPAPLMLPGPVTSPDEVDPEEVRQGIAMLLARTRPVPKEKPENVTTDDEWEAAKRKLKAQATVAESNGKAS